MRTLNRLRGRKSAAFKPSCVAEIILCVVCKKNNIVIYQHVNALCCLGNIG
jgi:hypothetical protein